LLSATRVRVDDVWLVGGRAYCGVEKDLIVRRFSSRSSRNESIRDDRSLFLSIQAPNLSLPKVIYHHLLALVVRAPIIYNSLHILYL